MNILYNTQLNLARDLAKFFKFVEPNISKPHLKLIPYIILGMIQSESVVTTDIVKKFKGDLKPNLLLVKLILIMNLFLF